MPNQHDNSTTMRVQLETKAKIEVIAAGERRAMTSQLAVIVDEWAEAHGYSVDVSRSAAGSTPAKRDTPPLVRRADRASQSGGAQ